MLVELDHGSKPAFVELRYLDGDHRLSGFRYGGGGGKGLVPPEGIHGLAEEVGKGHQGFFLRLGNGDFLRRVGHGHHGKELVVRTFGVELDLGVLVDGAEGPHGG
ncbi:hypothetical protein SDC9_52978 [bioreactor metagenome]|uniref:Uncharacterized protein n=1 Tax=bioreactor metagenome TaxID=1076179 RepID=A0A644WS02_9ZZZZ